MAKIVLIGAGSHSFSRHLISDVLWYPELRDSTITLMDIDKEQLDLITDFTKKLVEQHGFNTQIESTTNRRESLDGADYIIVSIQVGKRQPDREITAKYGVEDVWWTGPDEVFNGLRQIPAILDICHDMEELCPDAWLLNYSNPVPMICWAINDYTRIKNVGLCHSVQSTSNELARYIDVPYDEISYWVAGINHMAWFLEFKWRGEDAYPLLREKFKDPAVYSKSNAHWAGPDIVRAEIFKTFGYFSTEASFMVATLTPYFRKKDRPELHERYKFDYGGFEIGRKKRTKQDEELRQQLRSNHKFPISRSTEYGSSIIHSIETGTPSRIHGNVKNKGLITNLLEGCCVEVPCLVEKHGINPCYVGDLPPQLAALNRPSISAQELMVRGIVEKDKTKIFHSILLDPLTSAILTIDETRQMVDELFKVEAKYLKGFK